MSATMIRMEENFRMVDVLNADQLEVGDLIGIGDEVVKIISIETTKLGFELTIENDFSEKDVVECEYNERFELFIENF
jgi:hypothetical protein